MKNSFMLNICLCNFIAPIFIYIDSDQTGFLLFAVLQTYHDNDLLVLPVINPLSGNARRYSLLCLMPDFFHHVENVTTQHINVTL